MLVVDDFLDAREMYAEYFAFSGFGVVEASNGAEAVQKAIDLTPQVILMDLSMPGVDGWEATRRLKADRRTRDIPVIALTGHALTGFSESAKLAGCDAFVTKPCLPDALVEEVRRVLGGPKAGADVERDPHMPKLSSSSPVGPQASGGSSVREARKNLRRRPPADSRLRESAQPRSR